MTDYYVGSQADYASPQAAINQLISDIGNTPFAAQHNIIITDGAVYGSYEVSGLTPTSSYRLVITAATSSKPIIIAQSSGERVVRVAYIASPYVTIERQEFRGGAYGIVVGSGAEGFILKQCMVRDPFQIGVAVRGADSVVLFDNVIYAPNTCVAIVEAKNFGIFFNTMKNGQNADYRDLYSLPPGTQDPYPQACVVYIEKSPTDDSTVYLKNNNLVSVNGPVVATSRHTARHLTSDYNNLFSPANAIAIFVPSYGKKAMGLTEWRKLSSQDAHSISEDPRFQQGQVLRDLEDGIYQDLHLRKASKLRAKAEDLSGVSYPAFVPVVNFTGDFDDVVRTTPNATLGAYELQGSVYNYWDRIFPMSGDDPHGDTEGIYEIAKEHYASVVNPWFPRVKSGFFWARDNLFYLYSNKQATTLDQLRWFRFTFTGEVIPGSVTAWFDGTELEEDEWNIRGNEFIFKSAGFQVTGELMEVSISGEQLIWSTGDNGFTTGEYSWSDTIENSDTVFVIDPAPADGAPIVITDGTIDVNTDTGDLPFGFSVSYDEDLEEVTLQLQTIQLTKSGFAGASDPYTLNDIIDTFTWSGFDTYGNLTAFPGLDAWGATIRSLDYSELSQMTIEWETSNTGVYEVADLSVNPIHNPKTDGFLVIRNIDASQWDRALASGESTLEDNWLEGRAGDLLPWACVTGKNKWRQLIREFSAPVSKAAAVNYPTGECQVIDSAPGPLVALQDTTGEEVVFTFVDSEANPWVFGLANFELSTGSNPTGEFPGYIAKREFGLYTHLGQEIDNLETDSAGNIALRYIPPPSSMIVLFTPILVTSGDDNWFVTPYDIYPDRFGNPTITNQSGGLITLTGDSVSETLTGDLSGGYYYYNMSLYPKSGTVKVVEDGVRQQEIFHESVQDGQVYVDVENKRIKSKSDGPLSVTFMPMLVWRTPFESRKLYVSDSLSLSSNFIVGYDAWIKLTATAGGVSQIHDIVCRNPYDTGDT